MTIYGKSFVSVASASSQSLRPLPLPNSPMIRPATFRLWRREALTSASSRRTVMPSVASNRGRLPWRGFDAGHHDHPHLRAIAHVHFEGS